MIETRSVISSWWLGASHSGDLLADSSAFGNFRSKRKEGDWWQLSPGRTLGRRRWKMKYEPVIFVRYNMWFQGEMVCSHLIMSFHMHEFKILFVNNNSLEWWALVGNLLLLLKCILLFFKLSAKALGPPRVPMQPRVTTQPRRVESIPKCPFLLSSRPSHSNILHSPSFNVES